jgi:hypothetical protein
MKGDAMKGDAMHKGDAMKGDAMKKIQQPSRNLISRCLSGNTRIKPGCL